MIGLLNELAKSKSAHISPPESPTTRRSGGLYFSAIGGKIQRHGSALIGASNTVEPWILVQSTRFENTQ